MKTYKLTREEIQQVFDKWYGDYGKCPEDFDTNEGQDASSTFLDYLEEVRRDKNPV